MGKTKLNIPMLAALILLFLTMLSTHLTCGLYARYTATGTASDSARVAKFDVKGSSKGNVTVACTDAGSTGEYTIEVTNNSEVAIRYTIELVFEEALVGTDQLFTLDGNHATSSIDTNHLTFSGGTMPPNAAQPNSHVLKVQMVNWHAIGQRVTNEQTAQWEQKFTVNIHAEQID